MTIATMTNDDWLLVVVFAFLFLCAIWAMFQIPDFSPQKKEGETGSNSPSSCKHRFDDPEPEICSGPATPIDVVRGITFVERQRRRCELCHELEVRYRTAGDVPGPWVLNPMEIERMRLLNIDLSSLSKISSEDDACINDSHDFDDPKPTAYCSALLERFGVFSEREKPVEVQIRRCKRCGEVDTRYRSYSYVSDLRGPWKTSVQEAEKS